MVLRVDGGKQETYHCAAADNALLALIGVEAGQGAGRNLP
jgi:hypothetical protein